MPGAPAAEYLSYKCLLAMNFRSASSFYRCTSYRAVAVDYATLGVPNMESRAKLLGHPVHPMLIVFPLGLLATEIAFDIVALVQNDSSWFHLSFWMIAAG